MNRTTWLQDRRMQKFRDVLSRWEQKELSALDAGEVLGMSERQFRRYRARYEEDGLEGLIDQRLGKASAKRVPVDEIDWMLDEYRTHHLGWNVKHFHEHLQARYSFRWGYTWVKTQLHTAGLVERAKRRGPHRRKRLRKPCVGMMLHQDASQFAWLAAGPELDLIVPMAEAANRFLRDVYLPRHNARFAKPPAIEQSAFVTLADPASLAEILCIEEERIVARDNTVAYEKLRLQLPESRVRAHYVKARVKVHEYPDGMLAVFHGPRLLARYDAAGQALNDELKAAA